MATEPASLHGLNPLQRQAVLEGDGPCLVVATVGSGKTSVLTRRLAWLLETGRADPARLLVLTFTNKAAREMHQRVRLLLGPAAAARIPFFGTFHAVCRRLLGTELPLARYGYRPGFSVYDEAEREEVLARVAQAEGLAPSPRGGGGRGGRAAAGLAEAVSRMKLNAHGSFTLAGRGAAPEATAPTLWEAEVFRLYQEALVAANALDFDDLILLPVRMLLEDAELRRRLRSRFDHLLVDEFQDTSYLQYLLLKGLLGPAENLFAVGDPSQSIYTWRGARPEIFDRFREEYPRARVFHLSQNYRSTAAILRAAACLADPGDLGPGGGPEELWTENAGGRPPLLLACADEADEADFVAAEAARLHREEGVPWGAIGVLFRLHAQAPRLEAALRRGGVPVRVVARTRLLDLPPVRRLLALFKVLANPADEESLRRAATLPAWKLSPLALRRLTQAGEGEGIGLSGALRSLEDLEGLDGRTRAAATRLAGALEDLRAEATVRPPWELFDLAVERCGLPGKEIPLHTAEGQELWKRVGRLREIARRQEGLAPWEAFDAWLAELTLSTGLEIADEETRGEAVSLMTLHSAKGLEFEAVFLVGLNEGLLPLAGKAEGTPELEEERRLCFVGMTRARSRLYLTYAREIRRRGAAPWTSRFLERILPDLLVREGLPGEGAAAVGSRAEAEASTPEGDGLAPGGGAASAPQPIPPARRAPAPGDRVRHPRLGEGTVLEVAGGRARIRFDEGEERELLLAFAPELAVIE